ncbi:MAG: endonuclease III [Christensenellales bacterium]
MTEEEAKKLLEELKKMHPNAGCELNYSTPFELLVAVILSAQCTDKRVNMITEKLFKVYNTPEQFAALTPEELKPYIYSCGFFNSKGNNIIAMSKELVEKYGGEVPRDFDKLTALAGVGRKTASVVLSVGFDIPAMPVDTHVNRVAKRIGFSQGNTVEKVEEDLKKLFPPEDWNALHHSMIFHGRYICESRKPRCSECTLSDRCVYFNNCK